MACLDYFLLECESFCFGQLFCSKNFWPFGARKKILSFGRFLSWEPHWSVLTWIMQINNNSSLTQWSKMHQSEQQKSLFWQKMVLLGKKGVQSKIVNQDKEQQNENSSQKVSSKKYLDGKERKGERKKDGMWLERTIEARLTSFWWSRERRGRKEVLKKETQR